MTNVPVGQWNHRHRRLANIGDESLNRQYYGLSPCPLCTGMTMGLSAPRQSGRLKPIRSDCTTWPATSGSGQSDWYDEQYYGNSPRTESNGAIERRFQSAPRWVLDQCSGRRAIREPDQAFTNVPVRPFRVPLCPGPSEITCTLILCFLFSEVRASKVSMLNRASSECPSISHMPWAVSVCSAPAGRTISSCTLGPGHHPGQKRRRKNHRAGGGQESSRLRHHREIGRGPRLHCDGLACH